MKVDGYERRALIRVLVAGIFIQSALCVMTCKHAPPVNTLTYWETPVSAINAFQGSNTSKINVCCQVVKATSPHTLNASHASPSTILSLNHFITSVYAQKDFKLLKLPGPVSVFRDAATALLQSPVKSAMTATLGLMMVVALIVGYKIISFAPLHRPAYARTLQKVFNSSTITP